LPSGLLPEVIGDFAFTQGDIMGADPAGLAMSALAVCAAAIPDNIELKVKRHDNWLESARVWVALIGPPSTKKSPIIRQAVRQLRHLDAKLYGEYQDACRRYDALSKDDKKAADPPEQKRLLLEDTTIEAAQEVLKASPDGVLCFQDELSGWFGSMDKYAGPRGAAKDRGFWLQAYNGGSYVVNRISRGATLIPNLSVCVLGGIQPEVIRTVAADTIDDGLLQRLLPVVLREAQEGRDEPLKFDVANFDYLVANLRARRPPATSEGDPMKLRFDQGAQELRRQMERKHLDLMRCCEAVNRKMAAHIGKYDGIFARLCVVWHCIENVDKRPRLPETITLSTAQRVANFMHRFLLPHALAFYAGVLGLGDDRERLTALAGHILAHRLEEVTNRDVQRGDRSMRGLTRRDTETVFEQLEALGWVARRPGPRPSSPWRWAVNPEVHRRFEARAEREAKRRQQTRELLAELQGPQR
jgi:hypothetical protein